MKNSVAEKVAHKQCTGCFACQNACPQDAIVMQEDQDGFIFPHVNAECVSCGRCVQACPALAPQYCNDPEPVCYSYRANDSIRMASSSGGAFPVLARHFLESGAYVCGAIFTDDFGVNHVVSNSLAEVRKMYGSKYIQSNINYCYSQIKTLLRSDQGVLFTGTPCQVAGLHAYLDQQYDNLFTVDLICFGVPSASLFRQHLQNVCKGRKVRTISFRDKRYGWHGSVLRVLFEDQTIYEGTGKNDAYMKGFFMDAIMRESCGDCPFCAFPRQGDLTMGDFWGYEKLPDGDNDNNGTSIIFSNNIKGDKLLKILSVSSQLCKKENVVISQLPNRLKPKTDVPLARDRVFSLIKNRTFDEAIRICQNDSYDIGLVGPFHNPNVGGFLTYFALYHTLGDMGYSVLMIDRPKTAPCKIMPLDKFVHPDSLPPYAQAEQYADNLAMRHLNSKCGQFVTGSDQIFRPLLYNGWGDFTKLDWVADNKKKIAYAASFGTDKFDGTDEQRAVLGYFLKKFDAFSVREKSGQKICATEFDIEAEHVMDPIFLCAKEHYRQLSELGADCNAQGEEFAHGYFLAPNKDKVFVVEETALDLGLSQKIFGEFGQNYAPELHIINGNINFRLNSMINCSYSVTDSFHGLCLAIIFHKNFILWGNKNSVLTRITSLLEDLELMDRMIFNKNEFMNKKSQLLSPIDWSLVDSKLDLLIAKSRNWLKTSLQCEKIKNKSDYDMIIQVRNGLKAEFDRKLGALKAEFMEEIVKMKNS